MNKCIKYLCKSELPLLITIAINSANKCNKFKISDGNLYQLKSNLREWVECKIIFIAIQLDETFCKYIVSTIMTAHKIVPTIKTSDPNEPQMYGTKLPGKIEGIVYGLLDKIFYENKKNDSFGVFDFVASLLYHIVKAHAFHNGNKRTAILSISYILNAFGYYIVWANDAEKYIEVWEALMLHVAASNGQEQIITAEIKKNLIKATWLKL